MLRLLLAAMLIAFAAPCTARVAPFPAAFSVRDVDVGGATLHVRVGGHGPAVLLLHGFGDTGDMWQPLAVRLMADHTVIVPDLRGMGLSSHPDDGYDKKSQAEGMARMLHATAALSAARQRRAVADNGVFARCGPAAQPRIVLP